MAMIARRFVVDGWVQGVGFRYFVAREAEALGLCGWVRNLSGGSVEVVAAGEEPLLATLEGRLWKGPPHARVRTVTVSDADPPAWREFRILATGAGG